MSYDRTNRRPAPKPYQPQKKQRWPTRIFVGALSICGLLGLWQLVANEPPASAHDTPSFQDAEQQLQLNNTNSAGSPSFFPNNAPDTVSGVS